MTRPRRRLRRISALLVAALLAGAGVLSASSTALAASGEDVAPSPSSTPVQGLTTTAWNLAASTGADGDTTVSFKYALRDGFTDGWVYPYVYPGTDVDHGGYLFTDTLHLTTPGDQDYAHTLDLAPGDYTLRVIGNVECGGDCNGELPIADNYHFTITGPSQPDSTPAVTPSVNVACVEGSPVATVTLTVASVPSVATRNSVNGGWDIGVYDVLNYQPLQADKPIVYNISPGTYTFTGPVPVGSFQWYIDSNDYILDEFTISADSCSTPTPTPTPSRTATPTASLSTTSVAPDGRVTVTASGLAPSESVELWLHSTPIKLWAGAVNADGTLTQTVTIPTGIDIGKHQIEVRGATSGSLWLDLTVVDQLAVTGFDPVAASIGGGSGLLLLSAGIALLLLIRRRQARQS
ncbi:hypothetical protein [Microbacterium sp. SORGH_AS_0888]|uniref:hypothetical protein n=1 Tax=Microbacterium sp. SORGH_AS_0888 TaxID=3041791 RepID=UPI002784CC32|nr:hypothetical protein [Microbacterium sp. SORGH_AS_0888]MDQ1130398.1 hypothetical protein [Microbacterium sp. SORGH_AS_0888]